MQADIASILKTENFDLVDISSKDSVFFRFEIFNVSPLLYEDTLGLYERCRTAARLDYSDFKPRYDMRRAFIKKKIDQL